MSAPPVEPIADDHDLTTCPNCGTMAASNQEYCLECGARLPYAEGLPHRLGVTWKRRLHRYPGDWIWPVLGLGLIAALGAGAAILSTSTRESAAPTTVVLTSPTISVPVPAQTIVPTLPTVPPPTTTSAPVATRPPKHRTKPPAKGPKAAILDWPRSRSAYTLVLGSIPKPSGRADALAVARTAKAAGLRRVGLIDSDRFSSLHPGYWVVFNGIYGSYSQASEQLARAHALGYPAAYPTRVTS